MYSFHSKAIQSILARNPRAFTNSGNAPIQKLPPGEACNCIRSRCLKLYCTCFQVGKACNPACSCVGCLNTEVDEGGHRAAAIELTLEKRPDAFEKPKPKEIGSGCACKNNRCVRKYCECFRTQLSCTSKCSCRDCANLDDPEKVRVSPSKSKKVAV
jgi:Tesmin/TSO1-like CXC domain, cysteine-rich domain